MRLHRLLSILYFLCIGCPSAVRAQGDLREKIKLNALVAVENVRTWQIEKIVDSLYPSVVLMVGGREAAISTLKDNKARLDKAGIKCDAIVVGTVWEPVAVDNKVFAVVPVTAHLTNPNSRIDQNTYYLAVSTDRGGAWYFLDGTVLSPGLVKQLFPDFPINLRLPDPQKPTVTPL